uniref:Uncharacterized protein n=1 Tax=mine drainage metagenome TaxID=410659 RepID=E6QIN9_9ZZZZ
MSYALFLPGDGLSLRSLGVGSLSVGGRALFLPPNLGSSRASLRLPLFPNPSFLSAKAAFLRFFGLMAFMVPLKASQGTIEGWKIPIRRTPRFSMRSGVRSAWLR